ncbi:YdiK family protein [Robertmurraya andreesenii]|uniref:Membrane-bound ClpP family serine protease n=1 Tax=Anoxybacillus andreesenii TaxID=1325932 RepID=A0ABT9V9U7_9BACL|nr:YdiK family protein [Robertmurraya andreesenii]MDQ0157726.1 membrane-bound ClpP family serine protease [Robertmurraya andreesenii]
MRQSTLFSGILYIVFGLFFTFFAIQNLQQTGEWGFFTYLLILLATFDIGGGLRMVFFHFKLKSIQKNKK